MLDFFKLWILYPSSDGRSESISVPLVLLYNFLFRQGLRPELTNDQIRWLTLYIEFHLTIMVVRSLCLTSPVSQQLCNTRHSVLLWKANKSSIFPYCFVSNIKLSKYTSVLRCDTMGTENMCSVSLVKLMGLLYKHLSILYPIR